MCCFLFFCPNVFYRITVSFHMLCYSFFSFFKKTYIYTTFYFPNICINIQERQVCFIFYLFYFFICCFSTSAVWISWIWWFVRGPLKTLLNLPLYLGLNAPESWSPWARTQQGLRSASCQNVKNCVTMRWCWWSVLPHLRASCFFQIGDRVMAFVNYSAWAEVVCTPAEFVYKLPEEMTFTEAAGFALNFVVAYMMLFEVANLREGMSVLVHSAGGSVVSLFPLATFSKEAPGSFNQHPNYFIVVFQSTRGLCAAK